MSGNEVIADLPVGPLDLVVCLKSNETGSPSAGKPQSEDVDERVKKEMRPAIR